MRTYMHPVRIRTENGEQCRREGRVALYHGPQLGPPTGLLNR
jgi:hypothetical protein